MTKKLTEQEIAERHERFVQSCKDSQQAVFVMARYLNEKYAVKVYAPKYAKTYDVRSGYADGGDLWVAYDKSDPEKWSRVEIKKVGESFTSKENWPHTPHFFVNSVPSHNKCDPIPVAYLIVSHDFKAFAQINVAETRKKWYVRNKVKDRRKHNPEQDYYCCPMDLFNIKEIPREIRVTSLPWRRCTHSDRSKWVDVDCAQWEHKDWTRKDRIMTLCLNCNCFVGNRPKEGK